jgi:hypothetical protein
MDSKDRIKKFLEAIESEDVINRHPRIIAEEMGLSRREFSEATGEMLFKKCQKTAEGFVHQMMANGTGEPLQNQFIAQYIAHTFFATLAADVIKMNPSVNFGKVKYITKKLIKEERKNGKKALKRWQEANRN